MAAHRRVFMTGAAGFVGGYILEEFIAAGWTVVAMVHRRAPDRLRQLADAGRVRLLTGDLRAMAPLESSLEREHRSAPLDLIVHAAARASDVGRRSEFRDVNYVAVRRLAELSRRLAVRRFVFISTTDVYGLTDHRGEGEDDLPLRAVPRNPYPEFKIAAEQALRSVLPPSKYVVIRPAQVWGVGDTTLTPRVVDFLRWSPCILHFGPWKGRNRWPHAHVRNVAKAVFLAGTCGGVDGKAVNVVDSEHTSVDAFFRLLAGIYLPGKSLRSVSLPFWTGQCLGWPVSILSGALNLAHPFMDPSLYALYSVSRNLDFSNARMCRLFDSSGAHVTTLAEGLDDLSQAMRPTAAPVTKKRRSWTVPGQSHGD